MNDGSGFDMLNAFTSIDFKVIFISAFDKNTIQAFKLSGLEYLMKPINPNDLIAGIRHTEKAELKDLTLKLQALEANVKM
jgi:two-component system LytT family response regulator